MESGDRSAACMEEIKAVRSDEETSRRTGQLKSERARCPKNENKKNKKEVVLSPFFDLQNSDASSFKT